MIARSELTALAPEFARLAAEAGRLVLGMAHDLIDVRTKDDASPVTDADVRAEDMLIQGLSRLLPDVPVLAEESAARGAIPGGALDHGESPLEAAVREFTEELGLPDQADGNLEGWLAAATYTFEPDADATQILSRMVEHTVSIFEDLDVPADEQQEVLNRASIIEHEVNRDEDRGKVARVLENRLQNCSGDGLIGMDSTINYGIGRSGGVPDRSELDDADNLYNTRIHPGLPPTPIGAPGTAAIEAVLDPPEGNWCYFVTVNLDTGETRFTETYAEHRQNQELFREWLAENPTDED